MSRRVTGCCTRLVIGASHARLASTDTLRCCLGLATAHDASLDTAWGLEQAGRHGGVQGCRRGQRRCSRHEASRRRAAPCHGLPEPRGPRGRAGVFCPPQRLDLAASHPRAPGDGESDGPPGSLLTSARFPPPTTEPSHCHRNGPVTANALPLTRPCVLSWPALTSPRPT